MNNNWELIEYIWKEQKSKCWSIDVHNWYNLEHKTSSNIALDTLRITVAKRYWNGFRTFMCRNKCSWNLLGSWDETNGTFPTSIEQSSWSLFPKVVDYHLSLFTISFPIYQILSQSQECTWTRTDLHFWSTWKWKSETNIALFLISILKYRKWRDRDARLVHLLVKNIELLIIARWAVSVS